MIKTHFLMIGLVVLGNVFLSTSCQKIKTKLGIGDTITNPEPGSPEKVLQDVLRSALEPDEEKGWLLFVSLLHSDETELPSTISNWRQNKYPAIRRKVGYLVKDKSTVEYKIMDRRDLGKSLKYFVENIASDMPTPCEVRQDPKQGNAWKVFNSCF